MPYSEEFELLPEEMEVEPVWEEDELAMGEDEA